MSLLSSLLEPTSVWMGGVLGVLWRQYGDVFSLYMGGRLVVVLASYSAIREALVTFADVFSDRPNLFISNFKNNKGIALASGPNWKEQRKTSLDILRAMGLGKNVLADKIQEEVAHYIRAIKGHQGAPVDLARMTQVSVSNNVASILLGTRFQYTDPELMRLLDIHDRNFKLIAATSILNSFPSLDKLPGGLFKGKELGGNMKEEFGFMERVVARHRKNWDDKKTDPENTDFIYSYLRQMENLKILRKAHRTCSLPAQRPRRPLSAGPWSTSSTTPACRTGASRRSLGPRRPPSMSDRPQLTYLEATVREVPRKADLVPLAILHASADDVTFRG
ncbi:hypothetical protein ACOMHN_024500 [Nucella lapillus]